MKKASIFKTVLLLGITALFLNSCVKQPPEAPPESTIPFNPDKVLTIQQIKQIYIDSTGAYTFTDTISLFAVVTADESSGNIYKSAYVQDETGAIQLNFINSGGIYVGDSIRVLLLGSTIDQYHDLNQVQNLNVANNIYKIKTSVIIEPELTTISEIKSNRAYWESRLIKLDSVQFTNEMLGSYFADTVNLITEDRDLEDCNGNSLIVRTSAYANFAGKLLPEGNGSIIAIETIYASGSSIKDQLIVRNYNEIHLTGPRCGSGGGSVIEPVEEVNEEFSTVEDYTDVSLQGWTNIAVEGNRKWQGKTYNNGKYAQASGYNSNLDVMETWLITPPVINTSGDKILTFKGGIAYWEHLSGNEPMTVLASTDYDGSNFETATWTELSPALPNASSANYSWVESGDVSLADFAGNVAIAFKYTGSGTESTSFQVDDVIISDDGGGGGGTITPVAGVSEEFNTVENYTDIDLEGWTNISIEGTRKWQGKDFSGNKYAQATGYNSGLDAMETWLITPPVINTGGDQTLSFKCAMAYWEHQAGNEPLTILASTDYDGTNFETAVWTEISATLPTSGSANYEWVESGDISLAQFTGNVAIAFKYVGSDTESTSIQVDDVVMGDGGGGGGIEPVSSVNEYFDLVVNYENVNLDGWTNLLVTGDRLWQGKEFSSDKYVQATGYNSSLSEMETWLITPPVINTSGDKTLSFKSAMAYWAHLAGNQPITILASTDFDGTNFESATWTELTAILPNSGSSNYSWIESGDVSLAGFSGNVAIAFKYIGSDAESTSIQIDDVIIE